MLLHCADAVQAGDSTAIVDCNDLLAAMHEDVLQNMLLGMWDVEDVETETNAPIAVKDKRTQNRLCAQQARKADKEYVNMLLEELHSMTQTFEMYADYITQLKVHAADGVEGSMSLEHIYKQNKVKIAKLQKSQTGRAVPTLLGIPRKERNRIHAQESRQRKHNFVQSLIKQRDDSWATLQKVMQYTTDLENTCSVLHDFDDTGYLLLQLTETRQRLLMRTSAHKQKYKELQTRMSFRTVHREKNAVLCKF
jgi:hypothetical protein